MSIPALPKGELSNDFLEKYFALTAEEKRWAKRKKEPLEAAALLKRSAFLGYIPEPTVDIAQHKILVFLSQALGIQLVTTEQRSISLSKRNATLLQKYVREFLGWSPLSGETETAFLDELKFEASQNSTKKHLFDVAIQFCRRQNIELPSKGVLERLVGMSLKKYSDELYNRVHGSLSDESKIEIRKVLIAPKEENESRSSFVWMKGSPGKSGVRALLEEVSRLRLLRSFKIDGKELFENLGKNAIRILYDRAKTENVSRLRRHPPKVRNTLFAALCTHRELEVTDNVVLIFLELIRKMDRRADSKVNKALQSNRTILNKARILYKIAEASTANPEGTVRDVVFSVVDEKTLQELLYEKDAPATYEMIRSEAATSSYKGHIRRMLGPVLEELSFKTANPARKSLLAGLDVIQKCLPLKSKCFPADVAPEGLLTEKDVEFVLEDDGARFNRYRFEICVLRKLSKALRCKEVWVEGAFRFRNPIEDLPENWEEVREAHYEKRGLSTDARVFTTQLKEELGEQLKNFDSFLKTKSKKKTTIRQKGSKTRFHIPRRQPEDERPILQTIKNGVLDRWGVKSLLDILVEADRRIDFSQFFESTGQRQVLSRDQIQERLLLVLYSFGTNIGLKRIHAAAKPSCSYRELRYFRDRFISVDGMRKSIAALSNEVLRIRNPAIWGEGGSCASDGKHLGAWEQNLSTEWNTHYQKQGVLVYWHVEKGSLCIYSRLKSDMTPEWAAMIEGLVRHETDLKIERSYTDSLGQSTVAFAFAKLIGFELMPRLRGIAHQKLSLHEKGVGKNFPELDGVLGEPIKWERIEEQYDEMLRYVVAVQEGDAPVDSILRRFTRNNASHPTFKAFLELGKVQKTLFLCRYLQSIELQKEIQEGLNVVENWNSLLSFIFFGRQSTLATNNIEHQELGILSLQLLQNAIILVNTVMVEEVLDDTGLRKLMKPEDRKAITPLFTVNVNPYGDYNLDLEKKFFKEAA